MKMQPTRDRIIVQENVVEEKSSYGFVLPADSKETTTTGQILAVGPGAKTNTGTLLPMTVAVGDQIMFPKAAGHRVKADGEEYVILSEADILAVLN
jgi:chaperonin GroES